MNSPSSQSNPLRHDSRSRLGEDTLRIKFYRPRHQSARHKARRKQLHQNIQALHRLSLNNNMPQKSTAARKRVKTAATSRPPYSKALSQFDELRRRIYWNVDVALRGTGDLRPRYKPHGIPLNLGIKAWDDLWEAQEHIEIWRALMNNPHSSMTARQSALKVVLDDSTRLRATDVVSSAESDDDAGPTNTPAGNPPSTVTLNRGQDKGDLRARRIDSHITLGEPVQDEDDIPLALQGKQKLPNPRGKDGRWISTVAETQNRGDVFASNQPKRRKISSEVGETFTDRNPDARDICGPSEWLANAIPEQMTLRPSRPSRPSLEDEDCSTMSFGLFQTQGSPASTDMATKSAHTSRAADRCCDNIVVIKREPLFTPAPTDSTMTEYGELQSPDEPVCLATRPAMQKNGQSFFPREPNNAQSYPLGPAFETPQRSPPLDTPVPKHETIVIIDDADDEAPEVTTNDHDPIYPAHAFSHQQQARVTTQEQFPQHQASSRQSEMRRIQYLRRKNELELRRIELDMEWEALGGRDEGNGLGVNFVVNDLP